MARFRASPDLRMEHPGRPLRAYPVMSTGMDKSVENYRGVTRPWLFVCLPRPTGEVVAPPRTPTNDRDWPRCAHGMARRDRGTRERSERPGLQ